MKLQFRASTALLFAGLLAFAVNASAQSDPSAAHRLEEIAKQVAAAHALSLNGHAADAQNLILRAYLDGFEPLEALYGAGSSAPKSPLAIEITAGETAFHVAMQNADARALPGSIAAVSAQLARIREVLPREARTASTANVKEASATLVDPAAAATLEIRGILKQLQAAVVAYRKHNNAGALALVEHTYLEQFEPLESRLPGAIVGGLIIGVVESMSGFFLPEGFKDVAAYVVVLVMLMFKPNGLFGENLRKKV